MSRRLIPLLPAAVVLFCAAGAVSASVKLISGGSTFIYPIFAKWTKEYAKLRPEIQLSYDPAGSGRGISRTLAGSVDFGASDGPLSDAQMSHAPKTILHFPVVLGAVVPAYNVPEVPDQIRFTPDALAGIYLGDITRWDDPEIAHANPGVRLPARKIQPVFRSDGSGTTFVWTDFLSKSARRWKTRVGSGTAVKFPQGVGAQFNEGVVEYLKDHSYAIGYVQVTYAAQAHLQQGRVRNSSGEFVKADPPGIKAAALAAAANMPDDFRLSITDASGPQAYPIASFTWLLVPARIDDRQKRDALVGFLRWVLTDGQRYAEPLHYAPLPSEIANRALGAAEHIQ